MPHGPFLEVVAAQLPVSLSSVQRWVAKATPPNVSVNDIHLAMEHGRYFARRELLLRKDDLDLAWFSDNGNSADDGFGFPVWSPTSGQKALHPHWGRAQPMVLGRSELPKSPAPSSFDSTEFLGDLVEVYQQGSKSSVSRSAFERDSALFWAQNAGSVTPPGQWNRIAQTFADEANLSFEREATLFAVLNAALFDASIGSGLEEKLLSRCFKISDIVTNLGRLRLEMRRETLGASFQWTEWG